jgi:hypothetical protein
LTPFPDLDLSNEHLSVRNWNATGGATDFGVKTDPSDGVCFKLSHGGTRIEIQREGLLRLKTGSPGGKGRQFALDGVTRGRIIEQDGWRDAFLLENVRDHQVEADVEAGFQGIELLRAGPESAQRLLEIDVARDVVGVTVVDPLGQARVTQSGPGAAREPRASARAR